jgi:hypothetical protein
MQKCETCRYYVKDVCFRYPSTVIKPSNAFCGEWVVKYIPISSPEDDRKVLESCGVFTCTCGKVCKSAHGMKIHLGRKGAGHARI